MGRVVALEEAERLVAVARRQGRAVVFANGVFDLLHVGHVRYLRAARAVAPTGLLLVALNDDDSTRRLKGAGRPILPATERAEILAALEGVDLVLTFPEDDVRGLLRALRPDVHAKGTDYTEDTVPERDVMSQIGGRVVICGDPKDHSTRDILARVIDRAGAPAPR